MKKIISQLFILLLLLNAWGLYGIFVGLELKNDLAVNQKIDDGDYSRDNLVSIKIPLSLPYAYESLDFDRVEGSFEHDGERYRLIEKKLVNDTLTIICYRDLEHGRIAEVLADFVKSFTDQPLGQSSVKEHFFVKDYISHQQASLQPASDCWTSPIGFSVVRDGLVVIAYPVSTPPPEFNHI